VKRISIFATVWYLIFYLKIIYRDIIKAHKALIFPDINHTNMIGVVSFLVMLSSGIDHEQSRIYS